MKVLVSTDSTQGQRKSDFCKLPNGTLLTFAMECDGERVDGPCGCRRAMSGVDVGGATTTFMVVDLPMTKAEFEQKLIDAMMATMGDLAKDPKVLAEFTAEAKADAAELLRIAALFPENMVFEKRGRSIQQRVSVAPKPTKRSK